MGRWHPHRNFFSWDGARCEWCGMGHACVLAFKAVELHCNWGVKQGQGWAVGTAGALFTWGMLRVHGTVSYTASLHVTHGTVKHNLVTDHLQRSYCAETAVSPAPWSMCEAIYTVHPGPMQDLAYRSIVVGAIPWMPPLVSVLCMISGIAVGVVSRIMISGLSGPKFGERISSMSISRPSQNVAQILFHGINMLIICWCHGVYFWKKNSNMRRLVLNTGRAPDYDCNVPWFS